MNEILEFTIRLLPNGTYFTYMEYVRDAAKADAAVMEHCGKWVTAFEADLRLLDEAMVKAQGSDLTKKIQDNDDLRDDAYRKLRDMSKLMLTFPNPAFQVAAEKVQKALKTYKVDIYAQRDRETGMMTNLLQELQGELAVDIATLGLTPVVEQMALANQKVYEFTQERSYEDSVKLTGEVANAREKLDKSYGALRKAVNSYEFYFETDVLDAFILYVNDNIIRLKRQVFKQKAKSPEAGVDGNPDLPVTPPDEPSQPGEQEPTTPPTTEPSNPGTTEPSEPGTGTNPSTGTEPQTWPVIDPDDPTVYKGELYFDPESNTFATVQGTVNTPLTIHAPADGYMWPTNMPSVMPPCDFRATAMPVDSDVTTLYKLEYVDGDTVLRTDYLAAGDIVFIYAPPAGKVWQHVPRYYKMPEKDWVISTKDAEE